MKWNFVYFLFFYHTWPDCIGQNNGSCAKENKSTRGKSPANPDFLTCQIGMLYLCRGGDTLTFWHWGYLRPKHKDAKILENHLNPVMLVFIGKLLLSTLRWVPICRGFSDLSGFLHHLVLAVVCFACGFIKECQIRKYSALHAIEEYIQMDIHVSQYLPILWVWRIQDNL